jgi:hypothetical protein
LSRVIYPIFFSPLAGDEKSQNHFSQFLLWINHIQPYSVSETQLEQISF